MMVRAEAVQADMPASEAGVLCERVACADQENDSGDRRGGDRGAGVAAAPEWAEEDAEGD